MKRRLTALLLLAIYTVLVTVPAVASLTCRCQRYHAAHSHCCCHQHPSFGEHDLHFESACTCGHSHSTEVELYTFQPADDERPSQRIAVVELPEALIAEETSCDFPISTQHTLFMRAEEDRSGPVCSTQGLRAPPVLV